MKIYNYILILLLTSLLFSCRLEDSTKVRPQISLPNGSITFNNGDTIQLLRRPLNKVYEYYLKDTLFLDSVSAHFVPKVFSVNSKLTEFSVKTSNPEAVSFEWNRDEIDKYVVPELTDYESGQFTMDGTRDSAFFPFELILKGADKKFEIQFRAVSDATELNDYTLIIKAPIAE